ncbi:glycosyltransferase family 2 protein [Rhizorhapis suberifaciens]|uniref:Glycosyltransferase involved in cell wall biosynthesis n=1 Tax=Rhizorhapis suberifaciens TaxID=13656 RepID=A0A840HWQ5_9SPHN|nr:glycosyltransferase [Rhizorhapis suberifaciens]MBB4642010.1 glycosyltransferase involved in cell wall biosynthesis [Rhizorhapis suberifaciens]
MRLCTAIFAHNEEHRIGTCLASLPLDQSLTEFHILVNGSTDRTASIAHQIAAERTNVQVHELHPGGKSRTWNRFVFDIWNGSHDVMIFMDGDAEIAPGSLEALAEALTRYPGANASSGMPMNGRKHLTYQEILRSERGLFGDLYAVRGDFLRRMRDKKIRLPDDLIGDDGLIAALAATDLQDEAHWDRERVVPADGAGFYCEPVNVLNLRTWRMQYRRMINYSVRHFQNRIISSIMRGPGPEALPGQLRPLYPAYLPSFNVRRSVDVAWFDFLALRRMREP